MGQEAICICEWDGEAARVKALVEPPELILRGELRKRIPFAQMKRLRAGEDGLRFQFEGAAVLLKLDASTAERWAKKFLAPPPSLAAKLGITAETTVRMLGAVDDAALKAALAEARAVKQSGDADVIVARVNTSDELQSAFTKSVQQAASGAPVWIMYRKGPGHAIKEAEVRAAGLAAGLVDVKVAGVSAQLTALKFVRRKQPKAR